MRAITFLLLFREAAAFLPINSFFHSSTRTQRSTEATEKYSLYMKSKETNICHMEDSTKIPTQTRNPLRLAVLRLGLTEPMGTSPFNYGTYDGSFNCAYCGNTLFDSKAKYDSGSGWPSFWRSVDEGAIHYERDLDRLECQCGNCKSHLGHVFLDGPKPTRVETSVLLGSPSTDPRGQSFSAPLPRFCVNGAALKFERRRDEHEER
ncbi:hypothetical protein MPSEU_000744900 [Mayamaea pseudoterrestris]|nr:hypothetical protein MPSEU_000744900 [Mayamaea pseudoterrestris]